VRLAVCGVGRPSCVLPLGALELEPVERVDMILFGAIESELLVDFEGIALSAIASELFLALELVVLCTHDALEILVVICGRRDTWPEMCDALHSGCLSPRRSGS